MLTFSAVYYVFLFYFYFVFPFYLLPIFFKDNIMSTKNNHPDSPVVETTVVKAGDSQNTETATDAATEDAKQPNVFDTMANSKAAEPKKADDKKSDAKTADMKTNSSNKDNSKKDESKKESTAEKSSKDSKTTNATKDDSAAKDANKKTDTASKKTTATTAKESSKTGLSSGQHRVAILGGNRIPFARSNGAYSDDSNTDMLTAALDGLVERFNLQDEKVGEVVAGAVMKLSRDINLTREATLSTALNPHTPTYDISQACGTGLQATFASAK